MGLTTSNLLESIANLRHGFSNRSQSPNEIEALIESTQLLKQVHGDRLVWVDSVSEDRPEADAVATFAKHVKIGAQSADCTPLLFAALDKNKEPQGILAVHAGWKGTSLGIAASALREFLLAAREKFELKEFVGAIGPCISGEVYEVGPEVAEKFPPEAVRQRANGKFLLDIELVNAQQVEAVAKELKLPYRLDRLKSCTLSQPDLYPSYRRDGKQPGRIISFLELL